MVALAIIGLVAFGWCLPYLLGFKGSDTPPERHWTPQQVEDELRRSKEWDRKNRGY